MKLIIQELGASAIEQVVVPGKNVVVEAIRPHIYRHNFPTGTLKLQIHDATDTLLAESEEVEISDIGSAAYFHGYVRFYINAYLKRDQEYTISLVGQDGYSFDESAYCAWVNGHDLAKYPIQGTPGSHFNYPFDLEVWERTVR